MQRVFEALGDPTRRHVLELLAAGEQSAGAIVAALQERGRISQPAVSQQLKVLREAGLVTVRSEGTRRLYAVDAGAVDLAQAWLTRLVADPLEPFAQPLDALATEVSRGRRTRRRTPAEPAGERDTRPA
jgi:DNA-binding transcriptional ArsR family regulator